MALGPCGRARLRYSGSNVRILDSINNVAVDYAILYLTETETRHLASYLSDLLDDPESSHIHMSSKGYEQEITVTLVREEQLHLFDERSRELWRTGE